MDSCSPRVVTAAYLPPPPPTHTCWSVSTNLYTSICTCALRKYTAHSRPSHCLSFSTGLLAGGVYSFRLIASNRAGGEGSVQVSRAVCRGHAIRKATRTRTRARTRNRTSNHTTCSTRTRTRKSLITTCDLCHTLVNRPPSVES